MNSTAQKQSIEQLTLTPKKSKPADFVFLHVTLLIYSISTILSKMASGFAFLSVPFLLLYAGMLMLLVVYAVLWQQVLKRFALNVAFVNKSVTVVWGVVWGVLFFHENVTPLMALGLIIVLIGIRLAATTHE